MAVLEILAQSDAPGRGLLVIRNKASRLCNGVGNGGGGFGIEHIAAPEGQGGLVALIDQCRLRTLTT